MTRYNITSLTTFTYSNCIRKEVVFPYEWICETYKPICVICSFLFFLRKCI